MSIPLDTLGPIWLFSLSCGFLLLVLVSVTHKFWNRHRSLYPPGPAPRLLVGNAFELPVQKSWEVYAKWSQDYKSDIIHATALGQHIVILHSLDDAIELLEKRAHIYSSRPSFPMLELLDWHEFNSVILPYGPLWRRHRSIFQQVFSAGASITYQPIQTQKVHDALRYILETPHDFASHLKTLSAAIVLGIMYDYDVAPTGDHYAELAERAVLEASEAALPGSHAVNSFPILRHIPTWFPGAKFHHVAARCRKLTKELRLAPYEMVRADMAEGKVTSVLGKLLAKNDAQGGSKDEEKIMVDTAAIAYAAGSDTTAATFAWFVLAMVLHPDVQRRARSDILKLTGGGRLPAFEDRISLPYVEAIYREVLRWEPVSPLAVPHTPVEDDYYKGYLIPKGSIVLANIWAMNRNEAIYPDPEQFKPERFLDEQENLIDDRALVFGFGRRICAGRYLASSSLWLLFASFLASFDVTKAKDEAGNDIEVLAEGSGGIIRHPLPFNCTILPHSESARRLIEQTPIP
ncbi:cytochrome P450 [Pluteus cervinus]|uniref:Cytochrome P450 n=1 Tax=Pluteus cervinus TaxID=181527 RepID=A0ACD3B9B9_9AGAR|nr:cytochrome P450 [Pluteus cervinus]